MKEAFPLNWPDGWKRSTSRSRAKFGSGKGGWSGDSYQGKKPLTIEQARQRVMGELMRFGTNSAHIIISTNLKLRQDGYPYSGQAAPADPGVAVYWRPAASRQERCMAIDRYDRVQDNMAAIAATLEAMRAVERHGGAAILDRAFTGFAQLAAPEQPFQVLGISANATRAQVEAAYRKLASENHPDKGGDADRMARINAARDAMLEAL